MSRFLRFVVVASVACSLPAPVQAEDAEFQDRRKPLYGWNPLYHPEKWHPERYPPIVPGGGTWIDGQWDYVTPPTSVYPSIYPSGVVVTPSAPMAAPQSTSSVATNTIPYRGPGVTITLDAATGGSVNYMIDGHESVTIQAGQQQTLTAKGRYEIHFSRGRSEDGRDFGRARYTVSEGSYQFVISEKGWDLLRDPNQPNVPAAQAQPASPSGLQTNAVPPKSPPAATSPAPAAESL